MTRNTLLDTTRLLFPPTATININHLGLSSKACFDRKSRLIKTLANRNTFVNVCEIHVSAARAYDAFFMHVPSHQPLFNLADGVPGQCMMIERRFLETICGHLDDAGRNQFLTDHHRVLVPGIAHFFWWVDDNVCKINLHVYLDSHDSAVRTDQLLRIADGISSFRKLKVGHKLVIAASGDRNFVVKPEQHHSSASTGWHPGPGVIEAWSAFLASLGAGFDRELEDPTFVSF